MSPYYYDYYLYDTYFQQMFGTLLVVGLAFGLICWVLQGIGPYKMAKNAGIPNPWLAFIPVAQGYILGLLAQRSLYFQTGRQKPLAKINLWLSIAIMAGAIVTGVVIILAPLLGAMLLLVILVASLVMTFYLFYTYYHVLKDYTPDNAVLFLILTILFSPLVFAVVTLIYMNVVPVSVAGRVPYGQPKYNRYQQSGGPGGYGPQAPGGYGPQGHNPYGPQHNNSYHQGPEGAYQPKDSNNHQGPEL